MTGSSFFYKREGFYHCEKFFGSKDADYPGRNILSGSQVPTVSLHGLIMISGKRSPNSKATGRPLFPAVAKRLVEYLLFSLKTHLVLLKNKKLLLHNCKQK